MEKTEREKMLANEPYSAVDPKLLKMYTKAQNLLYAFNLSQPDETEKRRQIIQSLFGAVGQNFDIKAMWR